MHRLRAFVRPVSRCIYANQRRPTICRTLSTTRPTCKSVKKETTLTGLETFEELLESKLMAADAESDSVTDQPAARKTSIVDLDRDSFLQLLEERDVARLFSLPSSTLPFDAKAFFKDWSLPAIEPILTDHGQTLFSYISQLIEVPAIRMLLGTLDHHQALEFKKRWITYDLDRENPHAHLPVIEFFLNHGIKLLTPPKGKFNLHDRLESIDGEEAAKAVSKADISGSWVVNQSIFDNLAKDNIEYPDLMTHDALLDPRDVLEVPPSKNSPFHNRVILRNHRSVFHKYAEDAEDELLAEDELKGQEDKDEMMQALPVSSGYYKDLHQSILMRRGVVQQTGKGKIRRMAFMVLVGDGNGLVGYGEGKHAHSAIALKAARLAAVRNMDYVERFENRTIWTEMSTKLGATHLILRPRPVGFGLRCNPNLHRILRAAGLKDVSAKVWGSRNKLNVIKAAFRLLHSGHAPTGMGDGMGGKGKKLTKGSGMKGKADLERARGRKLISLRK